MILHAKSPVNSLRNTASAGVFCVPCRVPSTMPEITNRIPATLIRCTVCLHFRTRIDPENGILTAKCQLRKEHISGVLGL